MNMRSRYGADGASVLGHWYRVEERFVSGLRFSDAAEATERPTASAAGSRRDRRSRWSGVRAAAVSGTPERRAL